MLCAPEAPSVLDDVGNRKAAPPIKMRQKARGYWNRRAALA